MTPVHCVSESKRLRRWRQWLWTPEPVVSDSVRALTPSLVARSEVAHDRSLNLGKLLLVAMTAFACSSEVDEPAAATRTLDLTAPDVATAVSPVKPPKEWVDPKGHVWRRISDQPARIATPEEEKAHFEAMASNVPSESDALEAVTDLAKMDVADIVQMLRVKTVRYGYEYVSDPDPERAQALKTAASDKAASAKMILEPGLGAALPEPDDMPSDSELRGQAVIGNDNRQIIRANTTYPNSTNIALVGVDGTSTCSATMIGASTAITAGHCLQTSSGAFLSMRKWALAPDQQDGQFAYPYDPYAPPNTSGFPSFNTNNGFIPGCYAGIVPLGYNGTLHNDYAVIEFDRDWWDPSVCTLDHGTYNDHPGFSSGWRGLAVKSNAEIQATIMIVQGFPSESCQSNNCHWPSIFGWGEAVRDTLSETLRYLTDATGGQSGTGTFIPVGSSTYVVGIHRGYTRTCTIFCDEYNYGRRVTQDVFNNVLAFSEL